MRTHLGLHERVRQRPHALAQAIHGLAQLRLAQQLLKCHARLIGHQPVLLTRAYSQSPDENHLMPGLVNQLLFPALYWTPS
jgi:hypothetical protein